MFVWRNAIAGSVGILTGVSIFRNRETLIWLNWRSHMKSQTLLNVMEDSSVLSHDKFLSNNLLAFYKSKESSENEVVYEYLSKLDSQGHFHISHGGFTASMVEYAARHHFYTTVKPPNIHNFYIRYSKPMLVNKMYKINLKEGKDGLDFVVTDQQGKQKYCYGNLKNN